MADLAAMALHAAALIVLFFVPIAAINTASRLHALLPQEARKPAIFLAFQIAALILAAWFVLQ